MMNAAHLGEALNSDPTAGEDLHCRYSHVTGNGVSLPSREEPLSACKAEVMHCWLLVLFI